MDIGTSLGIKPIGLGARDTLRFEAGLPLYGNELSESITPMEAGLERFIKFEKLSFVGRTPLLEQKISGIPRFLSGIEMIERGIPRWVVNYLKIIRRLGMLLPVVIALPLKRIWHWF